MVNGTRVIQDDGGEFTPKNGTLLGADNIIAGVTAWTVAPNVTNTRDYRMTVDRTELLEQNQTTVEAYLSDIGTGSNSVDAAARPFAVVYVDESNHVPTHSLAIYRNESDASDVMLTARNYTTGTIRTCRVEDPGPTFEVDVSGASVQGGDGQCSNALGFTSEVPDEYQLLYASGSAIKGDYQFTVATELGDLADNYDDNVIPALDSLSFTPGFESYYYNHSDGHGQSYTPAGYPHVEPAIYSAEVGLNYRSSSVGYNTTVRVAPNEPE
jgi:hypothetical protein